MFILATEFMHVFWGVSGIIIAVAVTVVGFALTIVTLPGTWTILAVALLTELIMPEAMTWRPLVAMGVLVIAGEIVETFASAVGARKAGGSRRAALGSVVGSLAGAIALTILLPFLPIIATIVGAVAGAAFGAIAMQMTKVDPEMPKGERYGHAKRVGAGAAKARLVSIVVKGGIALAMGAVFIWSMAT